MLKLSENPPIVWPQSQSITDIAGQWWVAHTKSRNEKSLAHDLIARNISYFLPMRPKVSHIRGRKVKSIIPLFGGYLFFCGGQDKRLEVLKTNRVANIIEVIDQGKLIKELAQIEQVLRAGQQIQPHSFIKQGQRCIVKSGPLKNTEGIAQKTKTTTRLILNVEMLGQAASVEVDIDNLEIIN